MAINSGDLHLRVERVMPAPRARIFTLHSEADQWARWWGPSGFTVSGIEAELRVGGGYRIAMKPPDGDAFVLAGEFLHIEPAAELSYTFRWEEPDPDDQENVVRFLLGDAGDATNVTVHHGPFLTQARRALHLQGWTETLDRLHQLVVHERPAEP